MSGVEFAALDELAHSARRHQSLDPMALGVGISNHPGVSLGSVVLRSHRFARVALSGSADWTDRGPTGSARSTHESGYLIGQPQRVEILNEVGTTLVPMRRLLSDHLLNHQVQPFRNFRIESPSRRDLAELFGLHD